MDPLLHVVVDFPLPVLGAQPRGITAGGGLLWFTQQSLDQLGKISLTGVISGIPLPQLPYDSAGPAKAVVPR
ncbi:hypothetical protein [Actinocrispum wychmicini]|uniref:hypothetical protein n=1 Tax=Actinocrispum wychmicini TaxID=1213861 RepID=UPI001052D8DC|nr:hypothetical protein [Actinocrispum wychmicini]